MPGAVLEIRVAEDDRVEAGQVLLLVEAMKMEHPITAPTDGTVTALHVAAGDAVEAGAPLIEVTPDHEQERPWDSPKTVTIVEVGPRYGAAVGRRCRDLV